MNTNTKDFDANCTNYRQSGFKKTVAGARRFRRFNVAWQIHVEAG